MIREALNNYVDFEDGVYMSVKMTDDSKDEFYKFVGEHLEGYDVNPDPHLTLVYSKKPYKGVITTKEYEVSCDFIKFSIFGETERALVAELSSDFLENRHDELFKEYGFVSDFDEYKPHLTLVYDIPQDFDIETLPEFDFKVSFYNETVEKLNLEWNK